MPEMNIQPGIELAAQLFSQLEAMTLEDFGVATQAPLGTVSRLVGVNS